MSSKTSKVVYASQEEFDMILEENDQEFEMNETEAVEDALKQLQKSNKNISAICTNREERELLKRALQYAQNKEAFLENADLVWQLVNDGKDQVPNFLLHPLLKHGVLGMALFYGTTSTLKTIDLKQRIIMLKIAKRLCASSEFAREVVPPEGLTGLMDMIRQFLDPTYQQSQQQENNAPVPSMEKSKAVDTQTEDRDLFLHVAMETVNAIIKTCEMNKKLLYERNFNQVLDSFTVWSASSELRSELFCNTLKSYLQDDDAKLGAGAIEFDGFTRARKLGEETTIVSYLGSLFDKFPKDEEVLSTTIRMVCVTDSLCRKAIDAQVLEIAVARVISGGTTVSASLLVIIRHLCMSDEAKLKVGLNRSFGQALLQVLEYSLDNDEQLLSAGLSCLGVVFLRQPRCCDVFGHELDTIEVLLTCLKNSSGFSNLTVRFALIALRNLYSNPLNDPLKAKALQLGAEQVLRGLKIGDNPKRRDLKEFVEDCLRDLGLSNYRI